MAKSTTTASKSVNENKENPEKLPTAAQTGTAVAKSNRDDELSEYSGAGMETATARDRLIPRITILQPLSPQLSPRKAEYLPNAKAGMIVDVATGALFDPEKGIEFLIVSYRKEYLEWAPRASGKGLVGVHTDPAIMATTRPQPKGPPANAAGNLIVETAQFYGYNLSNDMRVGFIGMASTQLKVAKRIMTAAEGLKMTMGDGSKRKAPLWYQSYKLSVVTQSNAEGEWGGWKFEPGRNIWTIVDQEKLPWPDFKKEIVAFGNSINSGSVRGDVESTGPDQGGAHGQDIGAHGEPI